MLIAIWPLVFLVVGLLVWALASNAKVAEAGRITFFCGLFFLVWGLSGRALKLASAGLIETAHPTALRT